METVSKQLSGKYGIGKEVLLSKDDYEKVKHKSLCVLQSGYVMIYDDGKMKYLHRWLFGLETGDESHVDHKNGNKLDCTRDNIRVGSRSDNMCNRKKGCVGGFKPSSKYKGVTKVGNRYYSKIKKDGIQYYLGCFEIENEAAQAYNNKAIELHQNFAVLNIIK